MTLPKISFATLGLSALPFISSAAPGYDYATGPRLIPAGLAEDSCAGVPIHVGAKLEMLTPFISPGAKLALIGADVLPEERALDFTEMSDRMGVSFAASKRDI